MRVVLTVVRQVPWVLVLAGSALTTLGSLAYFDSEELAPFIIEKLPLPLEDVWLFALRVHVVAAAWSLPACVALMSVGVLRRVPALHRWVGRVTGVVVLLGLAPSGAYLSLFAKGGVPSTVGFLVSDIIVVVAMVAGVRSARAGRFNEHRRAMWHVLAQLSVAVSSRAMLFGFDALNVEAEGAYLLSLWLPVVLSAVVVEALIHRRAWSFTPWRKHDALSAAGDLDRRTPGLRGATTH